MKTFYYANNIKGEFIYGTFPSELLFLISEQQKSQAIVEINLENKSYKARIGYRANDKGTIYVLTTEQKFVKSQHLFNDLLKMSLISLHSLSELQQKLIEQNNTFTEQLIHNLTSLNSYSIQNLFLLIPQKILTQNINKQKDIVKSIISEKPNIAVSIFLQLIKANLAMKVEFSVFEKTSQKYPLIQKMNYPIKEIVLSALQIFIQDFDEKLIEISVDATDKIINVDNDLLFVSLYYIIENAVKYCCPGSKFKIVFKEESDAFSILFIMLSIRIEPHEIHLLTQKNYRSDNAKTLNQNGYGIGMYRILRTLKPNNAVLEIEPRITAHKKNTTAGVFEHNQFKIKFLGQQDWFKANKII